MSVVTTSAASTASVPVARSRPFVKALVPILVGLGIGLMPSPAGLAPNAWRYFALFAAIIVGLVTEPIPAAALGLLGVVIAGISGWVAADPAKAIAWTLSGFANTTIWLIFAAYTFAYGYSKTGLGRRIALHLIRRLGGRTLGLGYAVAIADLALSPFTPSNTARSGGTIYPIIENVPPLYGSAPGATSRKMGAYLLYTALAATTVTSSVFLTSQAPNVLAASLAAKTANISLTWTEWFLGFLPVGLLLFVMVPALLYWIYPPEIKTAPEAPKWAAEELSKIGPMSRQEYSLLVVVLIVLGLWIGATKYADTTMVALVAVGAMVVLRIVSWDDVLANKQAWNVLVWFATLVTLAGGLAQVKFVEWLGKTLAPRFQGIPVLAAIVFVTGAYFFLHYLFASTTAHTTALFPVFLTVALKLPGLSPKGWALMLAYPLGLIGILTPYATGPSPIYYGSGYIKGRDFWIYGAILGGIYFLALMAIGIPWLHFLGM
jgi:L-tartrate/succinate antiporter